MTTLSNPTVIEILSNHPAEQCIYIIHSWQSDHQNLEINREHQLIVHPNAQATVIEIYDQSGEKDSFSQITTHIELQEGAKIKHFFVQNAASSGTQTAAINVTQAKNSCYQSTIIQGGVAHLNTHYHIALDGTEAECELKSLALARRQQKIDRHFSVSHNTTHTKSRLVTRGLANDNGQLTFTGKIIVRPHAAKTNASLEDKNLLLSLQAEIKTRPELEIYNDDILCTHGATVGYLDEEALFYLASRGIPELVAKKLLIDAFMQPVIQDLPTSVVPYLEAMLYED